MLKGENVKSFLHKPFNLANPKATHTFRFFIGTCVAAIKAFTSYPTTDPSLDFC